MFLLSVWSGSKFYPVFWVPPWPPSCDAANQHFREESRCPCPCAPADEWCWLLSEHVTVDSGSSVPFWLRNHLKDALPMAVVPVLAASARASFSLPPSLSHYIIVCVALPDLQAVLRSCWYEALAKFLNSFSGHSAICEQSGRALSRAYRMLWRDQQIAASLGEKLPPCSSCCSQV